MVIALTRFEVTERTLEVCYKIENRSGHDVWVCDGIGFADVNDTKRHEAYLDEDGRSLIIRKRIQVPLETESPYMRTHEGRFVRIRSGEEHTDSISLGVPVQPQLVVANKGGSPGCITRVVVEIGFYDGDLPRTIRTVLQIGDKLKGADATVTGPGSIETYMHYFGGLVVLDAFGGLSGFNNSWKEGSDQIMIPHLWPVSVIDEHCLEIVVDGVSIPYQGGK